MGFDINDIKGGIALLINGEAWMVVEAHHIKPGKGAAFVRARLKNLKTDLVNEKTFRNSDKVEEAVLEERRLIYQYSAGDTYHFMDKETYEETAVSKEFLGDAIKFLQDSMEVFAVFYNHKIQRIYLPNFIVTQITESEPGIKGDSSKSGGKPAKIDTGTQVSVPLFINIGDWVKIDTRDGSYVERVQK